MKDILEALIQGRALTQDEAKTALTASVTGDMHPSQIGAFLALLRVRPLDCAELIGFREALLDLRIPVNLKVKKTIDVCGTGGDGKGTFNISTLSAFVVAGAGYFVSKHGNSSQTSACGSSDVIAFLGNRFLTTDEELNNCLQESGVCYLHAPLFQPVLKKIADTRKDLGIRTVFNILGPLLNPSQPQCQLIGVSSSKDMKIYAEYFEQIANPSTVVMSQDGYDEISLTDAFWYYSKGKSRLIDPQELGFPLYQPKDLAVKPSLESYAEVFQNILQGRGTKAQRDVVIINGGFAIHTLASQQDIKDCILQARESLLSGAALRSYNTFHAICKL
jgi:anthranilate phosphoribosyltransferase